MSVVYIDVSQYNGRISWNKVDADGVFIRAAYRGYSAGVIKQDARLEENIQGAIANHIPVGLYFMSQAVTESEAMAEALFCLELCKKYEVKLPIAYDSEYSGAKNNTGRADGLSKEQRTAMAVRFCDTIKEAGYHAGVYASKSWFSSHLIPRQLENKGYMIWCAQYNSRCTLVDLPWDLWQFTSKGKVPGISGDVDMSKTPTESALACAKIENSLKDENLVPNKPGNILDNKIYLEGGIMQISRQIFANHRFYDCDKACNFRAYEFACRDGSDRILVDSNLVMALQKIRDHFGKPVSINSAYRTKEYNKKVGGATNSYHTKGQAADITVTGVANREVAKYAATFLNGVGLYDYTGGFVHVDTRQNRYLWEQNERNVRYHQVQSFDEKQNSLPTLRYNDRGDDVKMLQGILGIGQDGRFGPKTEAAVRTFQKKNGLVADGVVGPKTWAVLLKG